MIQFLEEGHIYQSIIPDNIQWLGTTTLVSAFKEPFLAEQQAVKSSKNTRSKWYGITPEEILLAWSTESKRATDLGHWYHNRIESKMLSEDTIDGLKVYHPIYNGSTKIAPNQILQEGIYPEHMVYLETAGITGQSDIVKVQNKKVHITDHKTSKEVSTESYCNWEGVHKKMLKPFDHLQDCHINHYALQMSIYMYCIIRKNPSLMPGKMVINHVKFVEAGKDKWGYPLHHLGDGEPIVESITPIEVPYLSKECQILVNWLKVPQNRNSIKKHT